MNKTLKHTNGAQPHSDSCGYSALRVDETMMSSISPTPVANGRGGIMATGSEGGDYASCVGCNANNGNAGRNLNANNAATDTDDVFAGGFANMYNGIPFTSQPTRLKMLKSRNGIATRPFAGDKVGFDEFVGKKIAITDSRKIDNKKDSGYYYDFQIVSKKDGVNHLFHSHNGSFEIKEAGDLWLETCVNPPIYVTVRKEGNSFYFEEYHVTNKEACDMIVNEMNIEL